MPRAVEMEKYLTGATWNILHGTFSEQVLQSISTLISDKNVDFICLQEAQIEDKINSLLASEKFLGWKAVHFHAKTQGHELAILWNSDRMELKTEPRLILFPTLKGHSFIEYLFRMGGMAATQRAAMTAQFLVDGKILRLTNLHASFEGGYFHRRKQFKFLAQALRNEFAEREIVCGDFNTPSYIPLTWRLQQKTIQNVFGPEFVNATPNLSWSFSLETIDTYQTTAFLAKFPVWLRRLARSRMDYIFGRNMGDIHGELLDLPGSDHRPLAATFLQ